MTQFKVSNDFLDAFHRIGVKPGRDLVRALCKGPYETWLWGDEQFRKLTGKDVTE